MNFDQALTLLDIERGATREDAERSFGVLSERLVGRMDAESDANALMALQQRLMDLTAAIEIVRLTLDDDPKALDLVSPTTVLSGVAEAAEEDEVDPVDRLLDRQRQASQQPQGTQFAMDLPLDELRQLNDASKKSDQASVPDDQSQTTGDDESNSGDDRDTVVREPRAEPDPPPRDDDPETEVMETPADPEPKSSEKDAKASAADAPDSGQSDLESEQVESPKDRATDSPDPLESASAKPEDAAEPESAGEQWTEPEPGPEPEPEPEPGPESSESANVVSSPPPGRGLAGGTMVMPAADALRELSPDPTPIAPKRPKSPPEPNTGDQGWVEDASPERKPWLKIIVALFVVGLIAGVGWKYWPQTSDDTEQVDGPEADDPAEDDTLVDRFVDAQSALRVSLAEMDKRETEKAAKREKATQDIAKLKMRLRQADPDEAAELESEALNAEAQLSQLRERADLVGRFVLQGLDGPRQLAMQGPGQVGGDLSAATRKMEAAAADVAERLQRIEALDQAAASRTILNDYIDRWRARGYSWPLQREEIETNLSSAGPWSDFADISNQAVAADTALAQGDFAAALASWQEATDAFGNLLRAAELRVDRIEDRILTLEAFAETAMAEKRLTSPQGDNALEYFRQILDLAPDSPIARAGFERIQLAYLSLITAALAENDVDKALRYAARARSVARGTEAIRQVEETLTAFYEAQDTALATLVSQARAAINEGHLDQLASILAELNQSFPNSDERPRLARELTAAFRTPGYRFRQWSDLELIVVPTGAFEMGYTGRRFLGMGGAREELPLHPVSFDRPFAISTREIRVGLFRAFIEATGYATEAERNGRGKALAPSGVRDARDRSWRVDYRGAVATDDLPVIHVSWADAQAFVRWLSEQTGAVYRLPTESEFEYVQRSASMSRFPWDEARPPAGAGNFLGREDPLPEGWEDFSIILRRSGVEDYADGYFGPAATGSLRANDWGVFDITGNVAEWTEDCFFENYEGKDSSGQARTADGCAEHVIRGSAWGMDSDTLRISFRQSGASGYFDNLTGFRVVRELDE